MTRLVAEYQRRQHCEQGEAVRWFKAFLCRCYNPVTHTFDDPCAYEHDANGRVYVEQMVDAECKVLISLTRLPLTDPEYGVIPAGALRISAMPDYMPLARLDHVALTERLLVARPVLLRATGTLFDPLSDTPVAAVQAVRQVTTVYVAGTDWRLTGDSIEWLAGGARPADGTAYTVEHSYHPTYAFLGLEDDAAHPDASGQCLPLRGVLLPVTA